MEENNNKKVPQLKENYMETLKNGIIEKKNIMNNMKKEINRLGKTFNRQQIKILNIEDKSSDEYEKQTAILYIISDQLEKEKENAKKLEDEIKNTIAVVRVGVQRNIDDLSQKVLKAQNDKNNLEVEIKTLETEKSKYKNTIEQVGTDSRIPENKKDTFVKNANKKLQELEGEISLKKSKMNYIFAEVPEYINQIDEMKDNLKYLDYDEIEKYEIKKTKQETEKAKKETEQTKEESNKAKQEAEQAKKEANKAKKEAEQSKAETEKEKKARKEAEKKLAEEQVKRQKLEQEKADREKAEEARKKVEEQAERKETNNPYREGEELPEEQTEGLYEGTQDKGTQNKEIQDKPKDMSKPYIYIGENAGDIVYDKKDQGVIKGRVRTALIEKRETYKKLRIKDMCKELAGNRVSATLLCRKINPRIISVMKNEPQMVYAYVKAIHNKEELPFTLFHELYGASKIKKFRMLKYTRAEAKSGAEVTGSLFNALNEGKVNDSQEKLASDYSLGELLDNAQISEQQKTAIKDYAIINGEEKAKIAYEHILSDARQKLLHIQKLKEATEKLPGKDTKTERKSDKEVTEESLDEKGLFSEKGENKPNDKKRRKDSNASFVDRVGKQDGKIEEEARKRADKKEELERVEGEIVYSGHQGPGIGE